MKGRNDYCPHCEDFNTVFDGVCCRCCTNLKDNRPASVAEVNRVLEALEEANAALQAALNKKYT